MNSVIISILYYLPIPIYRHFPPSLLLFSLLFIPLSYKLFLLLKIYDVSKLFKNQLFVGHKEASIHPTEKSLYRLG